MVNWMVCDTQNAWSRCFPLDFPWAPSVAVLLWLSDWTASWHGIYLSDKDAQEAIRRLQKD